MNLLRLGKIKKIQNFFEFQQFLLEFYAKKVAIQVYRYWYLNNKLFELICRNNTILKNKTSNVYWETGNDYLQIVSKTLFCDDIIIPNAILKITLLDVSLCARRGL